MDFKFDTNEKETKLAETLAEMEARLASYGMMSIAEAVEGDDPTKLYSLFVFIARKMMETTIEAITEFAKPNDAFTVAEIKTYLKGQDSFGDAIYYCNAENIRAAVLLGSMSSDLDDKKSGDSEE